MQQKSPLAGSTYKGYNGNDLTGIMDGFDPPTWERSYANLPPAAGQTGTGGTAAATTAAASPATASSTTASAMTASAAGGTRSVTETYNALTKEISQLQERYKTLEQQVKEARRMASYGSTGGSGLYRSVLETLEAALAQTDDAIKAKTEQRNAAVLAPLDTITAGGETELPPTLVDMVTDYLQNPAGTAEDTRDAYLRAYEGLPGGGSGFGSGNYGGAQDEYGTAPPLSLVDRYDRDRGNSLLQEQYGRALGEARQSAEDELADLYDRQAELGRQMDAADRLERNALTVQDQSDAIEIRKMLQDSLSGVNSRIGELSWAVSANVKSAEETETAPAADGALQEYYRLRELITQNRENAEKAAANAKTLTDRDTLLALVSELDEDLALVNGKIEDLGVGEESSGGFHEFAEEFSGLMKSALERLPEEEATPIEAALQFARSRVSSDSGSDGEDAGNLWLNLGYFSGAYITSAKDVMDQMKPEAANFSFREAARQTLEAYASIADLTALLSSPDITKKELLTILGKGVAESAVGDLLFIIDNADMFAQFGSLTPEQAWELGGRTVGAITELGEIGLTVYSLAREAGNLLKSKGIYKGAGDANPKDMKPPGWNDKWEWRYPKANKPYAKPRWFDPGGGEWRWHAPDKWHPDGHWDYNPWDAWNSGWQNIYPD